MLRLRVTRAEDLEWVAGEIHDWFFDVDDVKFDATRSEAVVPFRRWSTEEARVVETTTRSLFQRLLRMGGRTEWEAPWYRWILRIGHATRCELVDRAEIGSADFYGIEFDAHAGVVTIEGSIPVTISIDVRRLDVGAEETDEVIGLARYTTWSSGADSYTGNVLPLR
jgi:hypothetical protein